LEFVDALDVRIFCEMSFKYIDYSSFKNRHISPSEIGLKIGLAEKTVRTRVKKMERDRFIKYYQAMPNLSLFGLRRTALYSFEANDISSKHLALGRLRRAPGVVEVFDMVGPVFLLTLAGTTSQNVRRIAEETTAELKLKSAMKVGDRTPREPSGQADRLDWRIIQRLRYDALCPTKRLAEDLRITPRMVEYRITKLLGAGSLFIRAAINAQRQQGLKFFGMVSSVEEGKQQSIIGKLRETYGERLWSVFTPMSGAVIANVFGFTIGEPEQAVLNTLRIDGVRECSLTILKEIIEPRRPNWMDNLIERRISEEASPGRGS